MKLCFALGCEGVGDADAEKGTEATLNFRFTNWHEELDDGTIALPFCCQECLVRFLQGGTIGTIFDALIELHLKALNQGRATVEVPNKVDVPKLAHQYGQLLIIVANVPTMGSMGQSLAKLTLNFSSIETYVRFTTYCKSTLELLIFLRSRLK